MVNKILDKVWDEHPEYVRKFYEINSNYKKLCEEVEYLLKTKLSNLNLKYAHIVSRVKSLESFCEKINRKVYVDPFSEIADFAGVRLVYLYISDIDKIEEIIKNEFEIVERVNKITDEDTEKFGYGALHYLIKLKKVHNGVHYDGLNDLICEIQVRTILQDAWAIVAHHLSYKHEADIPHALRRKLNALSGLFETADDQFERLRVARNLYQEEQKEKISKDQAKYLNQVSNLDNFAAYIKWRFPERNEANIETVANLWEEMQSYGYTDLKSLNTIIDKTLEAVLEYEKEHPPMDNMENPTLYLGVGLIRHALAFYDEKYCREKYGENGVMNDYRYLIK